MLLEAPLYISVLGCFPKVIHSAYVKLSPKSGDRFKFARGCIWGYLF